MPICLAVAGLLAGCGGGDSAGPAATESVPVTTPISEAPAAAPEPPPVTLPVTAPPAITGVPEPAPAESAIGTRVVALDPFLTLPTLQRTGVEVVGVFANGSFPTWLPAAMIEDVVDLGGYNTANLEQLSVLAPDSLVGLDGSADALPPAAGEVAPLHTIDFTHANAGWRDGMRALAALAGAPEAVVADIAAVDAGAAELAGRVAASGLTSAAVVRVRVDDVRLHGANHFGGSLLVDAGFALPSAAPTADEREQNFVSVSPEELTVLDADVLFVVAGGGGQNQAAADEALEALEANPLWATLPAVQAGRVHVVGEHWTTGEATAAQLILDDIAGALG